MYISCLAMFVLCHVICCTCLMVAVLSCSYHCCYDLDHMLQDKMLTLNEHDLTVDQVPPNRALFVQPHLPVQAGLGLDYRCDFYGYHQREEIMRARYPGPDLPAQAN